MINFKHKNDGGIKMFDFNDGCGLRIRIQDEHIIGYQRHHYYNEGLSILLDSGKWVQIDNITSQEEQDEVVGQLDYALDTK